MTGRLFPIYRLELQASSFHFLPQVFRILLHAVACKTISPARPLIQFDLAPHVLVKGEQACVFRLNETHELEPQFGLRILNAFVGSSRRSIVVAGKTGNFRLMRANSGFTVVE
jgi:hypothetical protein